MWRCWNGLHSLVGNKNCIDSTELHILKWHFAYELTLYCFTLHFKFHDRYTCTFVQSVFHVPVAHYLHILNSHRTFKIIVLASRLFHFPSQCLICNVKYSANYIRSNIKMHWHTLSDQINSYQKKQTDPIVFQNSEPGTGADKTLCSKPWPKAFIVGLVVLFKLLCVTLLWTSESQCRASHLKIHWSAPDWPETDVSYVKTRHVWETWMPPAAKVKIQYGKNL